MSFTSIAQTNNIYSCSSNLVVNQHIVQCPEFQSFSKSLLLFEKSLGNQNKEEYWHTFFNLIKRYGFKLLTTPLPFNHTMYRVEELVQTIKQHLVNSEKLYPTYAQSIKELLYKFELVVSSPITPLFTKTLEILKALDCVNVAIGIKDAKLIKPVEELILSEAYDCQVNLCNLYQLRETNSFSSLILYGSSKWLPNYIFTAPRAKEIHLLRFDWIYDFVDFMPSFCTTEKKFFKQNEFIEEPDNINPEQEYIDIVYSMPEINWDSVVSRFSRNSPDTFEDEEVETRIFILEGEAAVFLEWSTEETQLIIDMDGYPDEEEDENFRTEPSKIKKIPVPSIQPGSFLLLRTGGSGDYVVTVANNILGKRAKQVEDMQLKWKNYLRRKVRVGSITSVCRDLQAYGCQRATENNLQRWVSDRSIRPQSREDFHAIMKFCDLGSQTQDYWENATLLFQARQKAGHLIRNELLNIVNKSDLKELEKTGQMEFKIPLAKGTSFTAFRVEGLLSKPYYIPSSECGIPFGRNGNRLISQDSIKR